MENRTYPTRQVEGDSHPRIGSENFVAHLRNNLQTDDHLVAGSETVQTSAFWDALYASSSLACHLTGEATCPRPFLTVFLAFGGGVPLSITPRAGGTENARLEYWEKHVASLHP